MGHSMDYCTMLAAVVLLGIATLCSSETFHIVPVNSTEQCEVELCLTLRQVTSEIMNQKFINLTLFFLPGEHFLEKKLVIRQVRYLNLLGCSLNSTVWAQEHILISEVQELVVKGLRLLSGNNITKHGYILVDQNENLLLKNNTFWMIEILVLSSIKTTIIGCTFNNMSSFKENYSIEIQILTNYLYIADCVFAGLVSSSFDVRDMVHINDSIFINNYNQLGGGIKIESIFRNLLLYITHCKFVANHAAKLGGAILVKKAYRIVVLNSTFASNVAENGGAIHIMFNRHFEIINCMFTNNYVSYGRLGGIIYLDTQTKSSVPVIIKDTSFVSNSGTGTISMFNCRAHIENTSFTDNHLNNLLTVMQSRITLEKVTFSHNRGSIYLFSSNMDITGPVNFSGNNGGTIHAIQSRIHINSTERVVIRNNIASLGGGMTLSESQLFVRSPITISDNRAQTFGGGIYAYKSTVEFMSDQITGESFIINNIAGQNGGGIFAVASTVKISRSFVTIDSNTALVSGGGLYLQENSKLYLLKLEIEQHVLRRIVRLDITNNSAVYGGGVFVEDKGAAGVQCQGGETAAECFIQVIGLYQPNSPSLWTVNVMNIYMINNTAESGSALYGGLLDRCTVSTLAEVDQQTGLQYIEKTVTFSEGSSITSDAVQVVLCNKNHSMFRIKKGETFKVSVLAIDQAGNPVNATIHSTVATESGVGRLKEGQTEQRVGNQCTELEYNVFSQDGSAQVELYADGPCTNLGVSRQTFNVAFLPCTCPVGFQPSHSTIECKCVCDQELQPYQITNCSQQSGTVKLERNVWIGVGTNSTGYIVHNCPFDYCVKKPVHISLNSTQERDRQCAFDRSGVLCGKCQPGLSLMLATSKCTECTNTYLLLLIPFALAGIALVWLILFFNLTIATGTIYGLIFYCNVLPVNYFSNPSVLTVFVSWVNLNLGIETCFYHSMHSQAKVLLQLVFPAYLFLLMFLIIILSRYCNFFATLLSNRNPVAALCTLILLSYSKLLQFIIAALQSVVLDFPGGSKQKLWLYDANVPYFTPGHTPQFVAAVLILITGGLFTLQIFFAQWFLRCSNWKLMKWTRNTKYTAFIDAYYAPFTRKHRYWVGLLLFALIVHNIVGAVTTDFAAILSMGCIALGLIVLKLLLKRVYKSWVNDIIETTFLLNLALLAYGTLYVQTVGANYAAVSPDKVSFSMSACLFLLILCYHFYKYVYLQSKFYRRHRININRITTTVREKLRRGLKRKELTSDQQGTLETHYTAMRSHHRREPDLDVLSPITVEDYRPAPPGKVHSKVTYTVVETTQ